MFQRVEPTPSDRHLGNFFGLAMPLLKRGIPAKVVQLETLKRPEDLGDLDVLLMTYEGMKPMSAEVHRVLAAWAAARPFHARSRCARDRSAPRPGRATGTRSTADHSLACEVG